MYVYVPVCVCVLVCLLWLSHRGQKDNLSYLDKSVMEESNPSIDAYIFIYLPFYITVKKTCENPRMDFISRRFNFLCKLNTTWCHSAGISEELDLIGTELSMAFTWHKVLGKVGRYYPVVLESQLNRSKDFGAQLQSRMIADNNN